MKELKVGERVSVTLEVVEQSDTCKDCFFADKEGCPYLCFKDMRSDGKDVIFKEVKE
ncbi:MAG: hypothetical protein ACLR8W_11160 [Segatella copri]